MNVTLTPEAQAFVEALLANGEYRNAEEVVNALVTRAKETQQRQVEWLRTELERGEQSGFSAEIDPGNLGGLWDEVDTLSDTMLSGEVPMREASAALPLQD